MEGPYRKPWEPPGIPGAVVPPRSWEDLVICLLGALVGSIEAVPALSSAQPLDASATIALIVTGLGAIGAARDTAARLVRRGRSGSALAIEDPELHRRRPPPPRSRP